MVADEQGEEATILRVFQNAVNAGDYEAAVDLLRKLPREDWADLAFVEPALTEEQVSSIVDSDYEADALYNLGAAVWSIAGRELQGVEILAKAALGGSTEAESATGEALAWLGHPELAQQWLNPESLEGDRRTWVAGLLGESFLSTGALEQAERLLAEASASHDDFSVAYAKVLRLRGKATLSREVLQKATERGVYGAALQLGNLEQDEFHQFDAAERAYRRGIESGDAHSAYNLGLLLHEKGRGREASRAFEIARDLGDYTPPPDLQ